MRTMKLRRRNGSCMNVMIEHNLVMIRFETHVHTTLLPFFFLVLISSFFFTLFLFFILFSHFSLSLSVSWKKLIPFLIPVLSSPKTKMGSPLFLSLSPSLSLSLSLSFSLSLPLFLSLSPSLSLSLSLSFSLSLYFSLPLIVIFQWYIQPRIRFLGSLIWTFIK